jgi:hypothetical protein
MKQSGEKSVRVVRQKSKPVVTDKSWLDQKHSIKDIAKATWTGFKWVAAVINTQLKNYDFQPFTASSISSTGTIVTLSGGMAQSVANGGYVANEIHAKRLQLQGELNLGATPLNTMIRLIVFQDTSCNGAIPIISDVLTSNSVNSFYNITNMNPEKQRFLIHHDERYCLGTAWQQLLCVTRDVTIPPHGEAKNDEILFQSPFNGSTASLSKNNIFVLAISDQAVGVSEPVLTLQSRLYYESF